jgi:hypothetical protein
LVRRATSPALQTRAVLLKLDELIRATDGARNDVIAAEQRPLHEQQCGDPQGHEQATTLAQRRPQSFDGGTDDWHARPIRDDRRRDHASSRDGTTCTAAPAT